MFFFPQVYRRFKTDLWQPYGGCLETFGSRAAWGKEVAAQCCLALIGTSEAVAVVVSKFMRSE